MRTPSLLAFQRGDNRALIRETLISAERLRGAVLGYMHPAADVLPEDGGAISGLSNTSALVGQFAIATKSVRNNGSR
jgi:hypothetical protein